MQTRFGNNIYLFVFSSAAILFACFLFNPFQYYFLNDDLIHIPLSKQGELFQRRSFRPIGDLSVRLDYLLYGKEAWGYHLTNLILHCLNTVLVFFLSSQLFKKYCSAYMGNKESIMAAVLFFVYAFHSESIFWIIGRSGSLGTLFFVPAVIFYLRRNEGLGFYFLSLFCFLPGLLTYEFVWIFPAAAILISIADRKSKYFRFKKEVSFIAWILLLFLINLIIRFKVIGEVIGSYEGKSFANLEFQKLGLNFFKLFVRGFVPPVVDLSKFIIAAIIFFSVMGTVIFMVKSRVNSKKQTFLLLMMVLFILSLIPFLSLGIDTHSVEGERFLYLPTVFASILLVSCISSMAFNNFVSLIFFVALVSGHLYFLGQAARNYRIASEIVKSTYEEIGFLKNKQTLYIDSLPQSNHGALMFRSGFEEGAEWLLRPSGPDAIIVLSQKKDNQLWSLPYTVTNIKTITTATFYQQLLRDSSQRQTYIIKQVNRTFNQQTDSWFTFKSDRLQVVK